MLLWLGWITGLVFFLWGTLAVLLRPRHLEPIHDPLPPITVLKPLKGRDEGLRENLESFFLQDYPEFELLFSVADARDPAVNVVRELLEQYPAVRARLVVGDLPSLNPKVGNLIRTYEQASFDLLLISDSNVRVSRDYLRRLAAQLRPETGVLTSLVAGVAAEGFGGALEATYLNTFYARGMTLAFASGNPCVIGKSMLFRKSDLDRSGGIRAMTGFVAEDFVIGEEMRKLGLEVQLAVDPIPQHIGAYSFSSFWARHVRWGRIRKAHAPLAFLLEPLSSPLLVALAGAALLARPGLSFDLLFALQFLALGALDALTATRVAGSLSRDFAWSWMARELFFLPMWAVIAAGNTVLWRGQRIPLTAGGRISGWENFSGARPRARTKWRATIRAVTGGSGRKRAMLPEA